MAVTGVFLADFSSFQEAVEKSETKLRGMETGASKVESALNRMVDNFGGRKVVQDATLMAEAVERVGGVSKLTEAELARVSATAAEAAAKLRAMGQDVPPGIQKIADETKGADAAQRSMLDTVKNLAIGFAAMFTARAAFNFVNASVQEAAALKDLSTQTHINVEELQLLAGAMSDFGVNSDELGKALFSLSRKVSGGDESVARSLHMMGLSLKDVEGLNGEELFLKMERGLATLQGGLRDTAASDLFGSKLGAAMAGASEGIDDALQKSREMSSFMTTEAVDALDKYDEAIKRADRSLHAIAANMVGPLAEGFNVIDDAVGKGVAKWEVFVAMLKDFAASNSVTGASTSNLATLLDELNRKTEASAAATRGATGAGKERVEQLTAEQQAVRFMASVELDAAASLTGVQTSNLARLKEIGALTAANAAAIGVNSAQFSKYVAEQQKGAESAKQLAEATEELESAGEGWQGTLRSIQPWMAESISQYLEAGVSQSALALVYGLTATQIRAVAAALKEEQEIQKITNKSILETTALWEKYNSVRASQGGTALDAQLADLEAWFNTEASKLKQSDANYEQHYAALVAVSHASRDALLTDWDRIGESSKRALDQAAAKAESNFRYVVSRSDEFAPEVIANFEKVSIAAQTAADAWGTSFGTALDSVAQKAVDTAAAVSGAATVMLGKLHDVVSFSNPYALSGSMSKSEQAKKAQELGGSVAQDDFGNPYVHVAGKNAGPGGGMGAGIGGVRTGGVVITNNITATGSWDMPGQAAEIARRIEDEVVKRLSAMGRAH